MYKKIAAIAVGLLLLTGCAGGPGGPGHRAFESQLAESTLAPVLMGQGFVVRSAEHKKELEDQWVQLVELLKQEPGFVSARLNQGEGSSPLRLSLIEWETAEGLKNALAQEAVAAQLSSMRSPRFHHLFKPGTDRFQH